MSLAFFSVVLPKKSPLWGVDSNDKCDIAKNVKKKVLVYSVDKTRLSFYIDFCVSFKGFAVEVSYCRAVVCLDIGEYVPENHRKAGDCGLPSIWNDQPKQDCEAG